MAFDSWDYYESVTIQAAQVDADLTDFVVAINLADLSSDFHTNVKSDGADLRAAKADGTELPIDLVAIDTGAETGELHVKYTGTLSSSVDTVINIYYGNAEASAYASDATYGAEAVWSHLWAVLHFEEDPTDSSPQFLDSTGNGVNGSVQGSGWASGDSVSGKLGGNALNLDGNSFSNKVNLVTTALAAAGFSQQDFTISMWVEDDLDGGTTSYYFDLQSPRTALHQTGAANGVVRFEESSALDTSSGLVGGAWDYISASAKVSTSTKEVYINGVQRASNTSPSGSATGASGTASIMGRYAPGATNYTNGRLDEFRIGPFQDASYGITEYNNQSNTSAFYSTSGENSNTTGSDPWLDSSYLKRIPVTIDSSQVDEDLTDFPIYIDLSELGPTTSGFHSLVKSDGADIRAAKADGTELPIDLVAIDTGAETGELHVKYTGTLSSSTDTKIYLYYDNETASAPAADSTYGSEAVWTADFEIVAHFQEDPTSESFINSTGGTGGTYTNTGGLANYTSAPLGGGISFSPSSPTGYVNLNTLNENDLNYSLSCFLNFTNTGTTQVPFEYSSTGSTVGGRRVLATFSSGQLNWNHNNYDGNIQPSVGFSTNNWYHVSVNSFDEGAGTDSTTNIWQDGANKGQKTSYQSIATNGSPAVIGANRQYGEQFNGYMDEFRYYNAHKSDGWMLTESSNLRNPGTFYTGSAAEDYQISDPIAPTLSSSTPADDATGIARNSNIVLNFDEDIAKGTGNITIKLYSDDSNVEVIDVTSGLVTVSGSQVTINPSSDLPNLDQVYVLVDATAIEDLAGNAYAGISSKDTLNFTTADEVGPTLSSSTPADNATGIALDANIVLNFDQDVVKGTGNITIKLYSDDSDVEVIDVTSGSVTVSGSQVTINPSSDLPDGQQVYLLIDATCFDDTASNSYAGISSKDTLNFTTVDQTAPTLSSSTPADNATGIALDANIVLNFDEDVVKGTGNITIKLYSDDSDVEVIDVTSGLVTVSGSQVTINPSSDLGSDTQYYLLVDATCFDDTSGNSYAGISAKNTLNFTTMDSVDPTLSSSVPGAGSETFPPSDNIVLNFDEDIVKGTGNITIKLYSDDSDVEVIDVTSGLVTVSGSQVTINPSSDLDPNTQYYLLIAATCFDDTSGNSYAGISNKDTLSFTTVPVSVETLSPADGSTGNAVDSNLELDFNQNVSSNSGNISIYQRPNLKIGSANFQGDIGEILVSKRTLSEADRQNIEGYLAWRWFGPTNPLPTDHSFKYRGPSI